MRISGMHLIRIRDADLGNASDPDPGKIFGMHLIRIRDADHLRILP
jgi:hypothetical protein